MQIVNVRVVSIRMHCTQHGAALQAVLALAREARGCDLKLAAVREMLGDQAAELLGLDGWGSEDGSPRADADEVPHRDEAPPQRIVQVCPWRFRAVLCCAAHACVRSLALLCVMERPDRATALERRLFYCGSTQGGH